MAYNEKLVNRLDSVIKRKKGFVKMKMFGGVGFLHNGNMCFGVHTDYLILRLGKEQADVALKQKNTKVFDITGRPMSGWVMVNAEGTKSEGQLLKWTDQAIKYVKTLAPKL